MLTLLAIAIIAAAIFLFGRSTGLWTALAAKLDGHLIDNWRKWYHFRILQLHLALTGVGAAIYNLAKAYPDLAQQALQHVPDGLVSPVAINVALGIWLLLGAWARLTPQKPPPSA